MRVLSLFFAGLLVFASTANAQQYSHEYDSCLVRAGASTVQQGMCAQAELTRQDERLNRGYQALMTRYQEPRFASQHSALREEERTWIKRRDSECRLDGETVDNVCLIKRTAKRADELESRLKQ
jgi:uncharacterized protein YecT (DUF1311 family)